MKNIDLFEKGRYVYSQYRPKRISNGIEEISASIEELDAVLEDVNRIHKKLSTEIIHSTEWINEANNVCSSCDEIKNNIKISTCNLLKDIDSKYTLIVSENQKLSGRMSTHQDKISKALESLQKGIVTSSVAIGAGVGTKKATDNVETTTNVQDINPVEASPIEVPVQEKVETLNTSSEEDVTKEYSALDVQYSASPLTDVADEAPIEPTAGSGRVIEIPSSVKQTGLCPNYTGYDKFYGRWTRGTKQRELSDQWGAAGMPSSNGIATLNDRYLVAVSPKFGNVGDNIDVVLNDGQVINATIADMKGTDASSEWGHQLGNYGVDIIEWEASGPKSEINLGTWSNVGVSKIINLNQ